MTKTKIYQLIQAIKVLISWIILAIKNKVQETSKAQMTNHWLQVGKMKSLILPQKKSKGNITKKYISKGKRFEPICDQNVMYKYEDDPVEYKKARKRI